MLPAVLTRHRVAISLCALAAWLGWVTAGLASLGTRAPGDPAILASTLERLPEQVRHSAVPTAVLFAGCSCTGSDAQRQSIRQLMSDLGGRTVEQPTPPGTTADIPLLILDAHGDAVYSGPLSPPAALCGPRDAIAASDWLPALIDGSQPALHLSDTACRCAPEVLHVIPS